MIDLTKKPVITDVAHKLPKGTVGLCAGRHDIPVEKYIFSEVNDVLDFATLNATAEAFIKANCSIRIECGVGINQIDYTDVECYKGNKLHVVVTGLTQCTTAVMYACASYGVPLTLWHYNCENGEYVPQKFNF